MSFHNVKIQQNECVGIGTHVFVDDKEIRGVRSIDYSIGINEVADVQLEIVPERVDIDVLAALGINITIDSVRSAIACLQFWMKLEPECRKATEDSVKSVLTEYGVNDTVSGDMAEAIVERVFLGECV